MAGLAKLPLDGVAIDPVFTDGFNTPSPVAKILTMVFCAAGFAALLTLKSAFKMVKYPVPTTLLTKIPGAVAATTRLMAVEDWPFVCTTRRTEFRPLISYGAMTIIFVADTSINGAEMPSKVTVVSAKLVLTLLLESNCRPTTDAGPSEEPEIVRISPGEMVAPIISLAALTIVITLGAGLGVVVVVVGFCVVVVGVGAVVVGFGAVVVGFGAVVVGFGVGVVGRVVGGRVVGGRVAGGRVAGGVLCGGK